MRNLKKILALALALVMTLSLMTVANAFNDDSQIDAKYDEAVTVLSNLKVFKGVNDGSNFAPKQTITRGEVAAIIYRIVTGDVNDANIAQFATYAENTFSDVKATDWYAGYIGYCANAQLIVGDGNGRFLPATKVNGYQALAMILRAIGYDANKEFQGNGWEIRTASTAQQLGLLKNIGASSLSADATREMVAEILFRTIAEAYVVKYTTAFGYQPVYLPASENQTDVLAGDRVTLTLGYQQFGLEKNSGEITAVGRTAGTTTLGNWETTTGIWGVSRTTFEAAQVTVTGTTTPWTSIGYQAYVYTVPTSGAKTRAAVSDVVITGKSLAVNTAETSNKTIAPLVSNGSAQIATLDTNYNVYYNGMLLNTSYNANVNNGYWFDRNAMVVVKNTGNNVEVVNGLKVDFVDNDNGGKAEAIVFTEYTADYVTGIANESNTGNNAIVRDTYYFGKTAVKTANLVTSDTLSVGDLVTYVQYAGDTYVTKAPVATGVFTQINYSTVTRNDVSYVIGGTTYVLANNEDTPSGYVQDYFQGDYNLLSRTHVGDTLAVFTDPYGYMLQVSENYVAKDYLYVVRTNHSDNVAGTTYATVAFPDGSTQNVYLRDDTVNTFGQIASDMYTYTVRDNVYVLTSKCDTAANDNMAHVFDRDYTSGTVNLVNGVYFTNSSVVVDLRDVIARRATTGTVYTGYAQIPSLAGADFHYVVDANGFVQLAFLTDGTNVSDLTKSFVVYHTNAHYYSQDASGARYYTLSVITDGELGTVVLNEEQYTDVCALGVGIYTYGRDGKTLTYESFEENWKGVVWQNGAIVVDGYGYPYDSANVNFFTLDIARGNAYDYVMNFGVDRNTAKAVVKTNNQGQATDIYVVYGTVADADNSTAAVTDDGTLAEYYLDAKGNRVDKTASANGPWQYNMPAQGGYYKYFARPGYVTNAVFTPDTTYATAAPSVAVGEVKGNNLTVELTYAQYVEAVKDGKVTVTVTPAQGNKIAVAGAAEYTDKAVDYALTIAAGETKTFNVKSLGTVAGAQVADYTVTVKVAAPKTDADLYAVADKNGVVIDADKKFGVKNNATVNAGQLMAMFEGKDNAKLEWAFAGNDGTSYTDETVNSAWDVATFKSITVKVTAEDGTTTQTYTFGKVFSLTVDTSYAPGAWTFSATPAGETWYAEGTKVDIVITCNYNSAPYIAQDRYVDYTATGDLSDRQNNQIGSDGTISLSISAISQNTTLKVSNVDISNS